MAQITHNISSPNDDLGDALRTAFGNQNTMNTELYATKVDKIAGFGLSENNLTDALVATIEALGTPVIPTLQQVLDNNRDLLNGNNFQGTASGAGNTGIYNNGIGDNSLVDNTGSYVNAFGVGGGDSNIHSHVNLFGLCAIADAGNQTVFSKEGTAMARISYNDITADRKYELPDKDGTFALLSDTSKSEYKTASFTAENDYLYITQGSSYTVTDPLTEITGKGFIVYILSGLDITIGSDPYNVGSLVCRFWNGSTWVSKDIASMYEINSLLTNMNAKLTKSGDILTGDIENISTGFFQVAKGTISQRPSSPTDGMIRYNNTTKRTEIYEDGAWRNSARLTGDTFTGAISATNLSGTNTGDQDLSSLTKSIIKNTTAYTAVTGTTIETLAGTFFIPANTFSANDVMRISSFLVEKTGTAGTVTMRVKVGTTSTFSSATTIATYTTGVNELWCIMQRNAITLRGGNLRTILTGSSRQNDITAASVAISTVAFDPTIDNYLFTSLQLSISADSAFQSNLIVTN